jgi:hypothetical protein
LRIAIAHDGQRVAFFAVECLQLRVRRVARGVVEREAREARAQREPIGGVGVGQLQRERGFARAELVALGTIRAIGARGQRLLRGRDLGRVLRFELFAIGVEVALRLRAGAGDLRAGRAWIADTLGPLPAFAPRSAAAIAAFSRS